ncbi:MAG TPA: ABC transporter permease [Burkholderiales bacterium]|nr:ABC transporter permease [Burkholderiales bacterium]
MNRYAPFEWIVAFRFMREGLVQTLLIILGVGLGGGVIIFMSAALAGLQANIIRRTLNYMAPIVIIPPEQVARPQREGRAAAELVQPRAQQLRSIDQWQKLRIEVERVPGVTAVTDVASGPGFALRGDANKSVNIVGIEPDSYVRVIGLGDKIVAGRLALGATDIVIGTELAKDLGAGIGDKLRLTTASGGSETLSVVAIFDFGNKAVNERNVYVSLRLAQNLLDLAGGVSSIELRVTDPFAAETIAQEIQSRTGLEADSWIRTNAQFFTAMSAQIVTNTLIRIFVGLTVALGIASVLIVSVVQKSKEIGILRAMGGSRGQLLRVFLIQGAFMGLAGSVLGSLLARVFLAVFRSIAVNPDGTPMFIIQMEPSLYLVASLGATLVGTLAAVIPARRAAQLDPAVAIRG